MAPNVSVPMNFGIRLLDSPTHSTLELKASQGAVIPASSVILSFNSPVIDHMTTTLHLTSVDMEEFSEKAVRYFVDAAYSGKTPPIPRDMFRDVNKMANVFEMSWLVTRCFEQFVDIAEASEYPSYQDLTFLCDEGTFVLSNLKSRKFLNVAVTKIRSLNAEERFITRFLKNFDDIPLTQLHLVIEIAGPAVHFIVKPLTEQLAIQLSKNETIMFKNCKYLLENMDLSSCKEENGELFEKLFDVLEKVCGDENLRWVLQLHRKLFTKTGKSTSNISGANCKLIPNVFHSLDCSLDFDEVVVWLGRSDKVANLWMFFEGLLTWMRANKNSKVECSSGFLDKVCEIRMERNWERISQTFATYYSDMDEFFGPIVWCSFLCASTLKETRWEVAGLEEQFSFSKIFSLFEKETKLLFFSWFDIVPNCSKPGRCGYVIKTVPAKEGANFVLSTDPNDYSDEIHCHSEVKAEDMHLLLECYDSDDRIVSLCWSSRPVYNNGKLCWDSFPVSKKDMAKSCELFLFFEYKPATS